MAVTNTNLITITNFFLYVSLMIMSSQDILISNILNLRTSKYHLILKIEIILLVLFIPIVFFWLPIGNAYILPLQYKFQSFIFT